MAIHEPINLSTKEGLVQSQHPTDPALSGSVISKSAARVLAVLRIAVGFIFLWAFFDKLFGLHYSTASANSWLNGGSPTKGFLSNVAVGPFESLFHSFAGAGWANALFMAGLLGISGRIATPAIIATPIPSRPAMNSAFASPPQQTRGSTADPQQRAS